MRRKSIGATSQAFHEPMSTGAFLEFLTGMQGSGARTWGPAQRLKCWSERREPASHGTVQLRLRKPSNAPQGQRIGGYGSVLRPGPMGLRRNKKLKTASVRVAGSRPQGPVGQVSRGLGARGPRAWGPAHQRPLKLRFFREPPGGSLAKAWVSAETAASEVGTWRETKPGYPPYPPPPPPPPLGLGERKRVFTLSAFGNHPTRPPRSADRPQP